MIDQDLEYRIGKISVKAGDVLVMRARGRTTREQAAHLRDQLNPFLPDGVKSIVIDESIDLQVLSAEEIAKRVSA